MFQTKVVALNKIYIYVVKFLLQFPVLDKLIKLLTA